VIISIALTVVAMLAVAGTDDTPLWVFSLALLILVAPFITLMHGPGPGLLSAALVTIFSVFYFSTPGRLFHYTDGALRLVITLALLSSILSLMIGVLRRAVQAGERRLRHQLTFSQAITGSMGEGLYALDREGKLTFLNPAAERLLGWREEDLLGKSIHDTIHCRSADGTPLQGGDCPLLKALRSGTAYRNDDDVFVRRDGTRLPVDYTSAPIIADGRVSGSVVAFGDITARKRAGEALWESEERLRTIMDNSPAIIFMKDVDGRYTFVNHRFEQLFHVQREHAVGKSDADIFPKEIAEALRANDLEVLQTGAPLEREEVVPQDDGQHTYISIKFPLYSSQGIPNVVCGISTDITARKQAEEQRTVLLAEVERALAVRNQFLSIASHELKTPVTLLRGYSQILNRQAEKKKDTAALRPLQVIDRQIERMTRLIDDLLDVSRIESGAIEFQMAPFDLVEALREVIGEVGVYAPEFKLRVQDGVGELWLSGDRQRIQQVMTNLMTNAIKYASDRREADVRVERDGDQAVVSVTDYGIGIPQEQQSQVFERYFRGANASANNYGGLGMGLYISRYIIRRHRGSIGVESEQGKGSTFTFTLPLMERPVTSDGS
jgi:PAS domain S-box-containing protein